ncbi:MAG: LptA/OstA family protein [Robiginitomaculum sp.]
MKIIKPLLNLTTFWATLMLMSTNAYAQFSSAGEGPISIFADNMISEGKKTTLTGGVDVRQGDTRVLADKMVITSTDGTNFQGRNFSRVEAIGNFYYITKDQEMRGKKSIYTKSNDTFVVMGDVILKQADGSIVTGNKLYYNLTTEKSRVVGTCEGRKCGSRGRVNILINNSKKKSSASN